MKLTAKNAQALKLLICGFLGVLGGSSCSVL
jgi:hypothetical protein